MKTFISTVALLLGLGCVAGVADSKPKFVGLGRPFTLTLPANPSTGYQWQLAKPLDETRLKLVESKYKAVEPTKPGAAGMEVWKFEPIGEGDVEIQLKYVRSWEKDAAPARTTNFLFRVVKKLGV